MFHQVDEQGNPVVNIGHVIETLNKVTHNINSLHQLIVHEFESIKSWMQEVKK